MEDSDSSDPRKPLLSTISEGSQEHNNNALKAPDLKTYKRRWYIVVIFSLFCMTQNFVWGQWGPISTTAEEAFGWTDATVAWMSNWGPIAYILVGLFYPWFMQVKGLRMATLSSMVFIAVGCTFRVITSDPGPATILIHMAQFLNGVAGPAPCGITQLSALWFPAGQRVTATALANSIVTMGTGLGFVLGPALVTSDLITNHSSVTTPSPTNASWSAQELTFISQYSITKNSSDARITQERMDIMYYMYYSCGWAWLISGLLLLYFPSHPPSPPCVSATLGREDYWSGLWSLRRKSNFVLIALIYGLSTGVQSAWQSLLNVNLKILGIPETTAGWIGFYSIIATCCFGLLAGRLSAFFNRRMKLFIFILYLLGGTCYCLLALMIEGLIGYNEGLVYCLVVGGTALMSGAVPLIFELSCEMAYPVGESPATGFLNLLNNIAACFFLALFSIPNIGTAWMNWALVGSVAVCIPGIAALKSRFHRLEVDERSAQDKYLNHSADVSDPHTAPHDTQQIQQHSVQS